jgi:hypothetical protein
VSANYWKPVTGHASRSLKASNFRESHFRPSRLVSTIFQTRSPPGLLNAVTRHLAGHDFPEQVIFVCFDPTTLQAYEAALAQ